jgi:phage shock protein C
MDFSKRLFRSKSEKMIAGVCGGLASYFSLDPTIVRLIFILLLFAPPSGILIYLILWLITPLEP